MYMPKSAVPIDDSSAPVPVSTGTYMPKSAVLIDQGQQASAPGIGSDILGAINAAGGTVARGLGYAGATIANAPIAAGDLINRGLGHLLGINPQNIPQPQYVNPQSIPMPFVSQQAQQTLDPLARYGAETGLLAMPAKDIAQLGLTGAKAIGSKLADLSGYSANSKATDFIRDLIGNQQEVKAAFRNSYNQIGDKASQRGYNLLPNSTQKPIDKDLFHEQFGGMSFNDRTAFLNNMPTKTSDLYQQFLDKPSYQNAHDFQSALGKYGVKLLKNRDTAMVGGQTLGLRNALNQDIANTFTKYGDEDLNAARQEITNQYAQNENRLLLADKLKSGIQNLPGEGLTANAQKIVNAYSKAGFKKVLGRYEPAMKTPESEASIADIMSSLGRKDITDAVLKRIGYATPAILGGAGLGAAYHFIR